MSSYLLLLRSRNHELFTAYDGEECLAIFEKIRKQDQLISSDSQQNSAPFDVVILDYRMPKKDGIQVARQILSVVPDQRIIIASAYTHELIANNLLHSANQSNIEILQKPFGFDVLLRLVERPFESSQTKVQQKSSSPGASPAEFHLGKDRFDQRFSTIDEDPNRFLEIMSQKDLISGGQENPGI